MIQFRADYRAASSIEWTQLFDWGTFTSYSWATTGLPTGSYYLRIQARGSDGLAGPFREVGPFTITADAEVSPGRLRGLTLSKRALLASEHYYIWGRLLVENGAGVMVNYGDIGDLSWFINAKWSESIDQNVSAGTAALAREVDGLSLAPLIAASSLNRDASGGYSPALHAGRRIELHCAITSPGFAPEAGDWLVVFIGKVDKVDWTSKDNSIEIQFRDLGAWLVDRQIKAEKTYQKLNEDGTQQVDGEGNPVPYTLAELMQAILDDNPPKSVAPTLYVVGDPDRYIIKHSQSKDVNVMDALKTLAAQNGQDVRYRWVETAPHVWEYNLCLYTPERDDPPVDVTLTPDEYIEVTEALIDDALVRNDIEIDFTYSDGTPDSVEITNDISIEDFGNRYMRIGLAATDSINTLTEANRLGGAVSKDLQFPEFSHGVKLRFWPYAQLGDYFAYAPNGVHYDEEQRAANQTIQHELTEGGGWTTISASPKPRGAYRAWILRAANSNPENTTAPAPLIDVELTLSTVDTLTYTVSATSPDGRPLDLYIAYGSDDFGAAVANPATVILERATVSKQQQTARVLARTRYAPFMEAKALISDDYDFVPGIAYVTKPEPLYNANLQVGFTQEGGVDDDARGLVLRILSGEIVVDSGFPTVIQMGPEYWMNVDAFKLFTWRYLQDPGLSAEVEMTPYEFFGPGLVGPGVTDPSTVRAAAGVAGKPIKQKFSRSPITEVFPRETSASKRILVFTVNPTGSTLKYKLGDASWVTVAGVTTDVKVEVDVSAASVEVQYYSISTSGVAENVRKLTIDKSSAPEITSVSFTETSPNDIRQTLQLNENVQRWITWAKRGSAPSDRSGAPDPHCRVDSGDFHNTETHFYAGGDGDPDTSTWYVIIRAYDFKGVFDEYTGTFVVQGAASSVGYLFNVRARLAEHPSGSGVWTNDILFDSSPEIDAGGYTIDVYENGVIRIADRDAKLDYDEGDVAGQGGWAIRKIPTNAGDAYSNQLTFTYTVNLKTGGGVIATYQATLVGYYIGDGSYEAPITAAHATPFLAPYDSSAQELVASWSGSGLWRQDLQFRTGPNADASGSAIMPMEELPASQAEYHYSHPFGGASGQWYWVQIRERNNSGPGPWSAWSVARQVPGYNSPGGGGGGL